MWESERRQVILALYINKELIPGRAGVSPIAVAAGSAEVRRMVNEAVRCGTYDAPRVGELGSAEQSQLFSGDIIFLFRLSTEDQSSE